MKITVLNSALKRKNKNKLLFMNQIMEWKDDRVDT